MPTAPNPGSDIVPIARPLWIDAGEYEGWAIALQFTGNATIYLVADSNQTAPIWISESEVEASYVKTGV